MLNTFFTWLAMLLTPTPVESDEDRAIRLWVAGLRECEDFEDF